MMSIYYALLHWTTLLVSVVIWFFLIPLDREKTVNNVSKTNLLIHFTFFLYKYLCFYDSDIILCLWHYLPEINALPVEMLSHILHIYMYKDQRHIKLSSKRQHIKYFKTLKVLTHGALSYRLFFLCVLNYLTGSWEIRKMGGWMKIK